MASLCLCFPALAGDINKGYTFTVGEQNVTHTKLNNLVDLAEINTTFFTGQSATTDPASADVLLLYSSALADFRKVTVNTLIYGNTEIITGRTEDTAPALGDFVLTYDVSADNLKKVQLGNLGATITNTISGWPGSTGVNPGGLILLYQGGTNSTAVISNVLDQFRFAHLAVHTAPTNDDKLLIWSSLATSNRSTTLSGFMTNPPAAVSLGTNSLLLVHTTNNTGTGIVAQATVLQIREAIAANPGALALTNQVNTNQFVSGQYALATELVARTNHGFSAKPTWVRWVLVCTNADNGYVAGEELDLWSFSASAAGQAAFSGGANSNTVFLYCLDTTPDQVHTNGTLTAITALNWNARCYARP